MILPLTESTPSERALKLAYILMQGREMTPKEAAQIIGKHEKTAVRTLETISRVLPIYEQEPGVWVLMEGISPYETTNLPNGQNLSTSCDTLKAD